MKTVVLALAAAFLPALVFAAPPPAPTVTVAASDIKQLQFDITPVTQVNWYELWFRANDGAQWVNYATTPAQRPRFRIYTSVHLLDWQQARYYVKACNPSGCSASAQVGVNGLQLDALGYFKPSTRACCQYYGFNFAVSADGGTMAVLAGETIDRQSQSAVIHVYRKSTSTSGWRLEARVLPSLASTGSGINVAGDSLSISRDGNVLALGSWQENRATGAAYLFRHGSAGWSQTQRIVGDNSTNDHFGIFVKLTPDGRTLAISHDRPGNRVENGTLEVYKHDGGSGPFVHSATVPAPAFAEPEYSYCRAFALSAVGHIARSCLDYTGGFFTQVLDEASGSPLQYTESARVPGGAGGDVDIDFQGTRLLVQDYGYPGQYNSFSVYRRESSGWVSEGSFAPFPEQVSHMALSGDGRFVAVGSNNDTLAGRGPLFPVYERSAATTGAVAVYERRASGWAFRRFIKGGSTNYPNSFGWEVAFDETGRLLAVGSPYDASRATGIDGDREDNSMPARGAVWLY